MDEESDWVEEGANERAENEDKYPPEFTGLVELLLRLFFLTGLECDIELGQ